MNTERLIELIIESSYEAVHRLIGGRMDKDSKEVIVAVVLLVEIYAVAAVVVCTYIAVAPYIIKWIWQ